MAADTFSTMYRELRLWVPELPIFLAKKFINQRYRRLADMRGWAGLRAEGEFLINAAYSTGTVTVTRNSTTVTGSGTAWAASDVGRQFQAGNRAPAYTITAVASGTSLTLDRVYGGDTASGSAYRILDAYVTVPADFKRFIVVTDPAQNWRLRHWVTQEEINRWDPARTYTGSPWALADRRFNSSGVPQYELWPYGTSAKNFPFYYTKQVADLAVDDDQPFYPLRGDELVKGALADLCRWPGVPSRPNPMFGKTDLYRSFEAEFQDRLNDLEREDESLYMTWLSEAAWSEWSVSPVDAKFMQNHGPF